MSPDHSDPTPHSESTPHSEPTEPNVNTHVAAFAETIDTSWDQPPSVTREVTIDAPLEAVWEAVSTDAGRERWLEDDPDRELVVEETTPREHITWWWWRDEEPARRVDVHISPVPAGTRVVVTETEPVIFPMASFVCAARSAGAHLVGAGA